MNMKSAWRRSAVGIVAVLGLSALSIPAGATEISQLTPGSYPVSAKLSCYVTAMGGVEFGQPLLQGTALNIAEDGSATITLSLGKSSVTIYSVTCDTFVDAAPDGVSEYRGVDNGTLGYYDSEGKLHTEGVTYTLSEDTALNPRDEEVAYVDSITFPVTEFQDEINLTMYINSNVMGVQFCNPNDAAETSTYACTLSVDWSELTGENAGNQTTEENPADVESSVTNMDGLNIHQTDSGQTQGGADGAAATAQVVQRPMLLVGIAVGGCLMAAGLVMILVVGFKAKKGLVKHEKD